MSTPLGISGRWLGCLISALIITYVLSVSARAQDTVTGAFEGTVSHRITGARIANAAVEIINQLTGETFHLRTDARGRFFQALLPPGAYTIRVSAPGFNAYEREQRLFTTIPNQVIPIPVELEPLSSLAGGATPAPTPTPAPSPATSTASGQTQLFTLDTVAEINRTDGRRAGAYTETEVTTLPLGGVTIVRSFDELALLLPGVAPPPQTLGSVAGPGIGAGVGSAGQFAVNGLRSRANNFTVDGSDNNDEDIGVRRQGFVALIPQPIESVKEYHVTTLLAPAQFGRNIGAQVNAVSKSGGSETHGTLYGFFNASQLNARDAFDTALGTATLPLRAGNQPVLLSISDASGNMLGPPRQLTVRNQSAGEDSFTFGQAGFVLGGPLSPHRTDQSGRMFYFISAEGSVVNATKEESFAVPTVEQRGAFNTGATGIFRNPLGPRDASGNLIGPTFEAFPTAARGDAIFSLYPFPNNPQGVYGQNTFTQMLPASGRGEVLSGRFDRYFKYRRREQSLTARYNFTNDHRTISVTGGALFSSLRPRVRTQNFSFFFNSEVSGPDSKAAAFNQVRLSYGRTRLNFGAVRDNTFEVPSRAFPNEPFLLNEPLRLNATLPAAIGNNQFGPNTGPVLYLTDLSTPTVEAALGPVGQVHIAGFSPVGVDVFNFPQRRVNNTYQAADNLTLRVAQHVFTFGTDNRRTELNSVLPRNARPLISFNGAPEIDLTSAGTFTYSNRFIRPETFAALEAASNFSQTLATGGEAGLNLRFYQLNFFGQDEWRIRLKRHYLSLSYGLRYEYNTPPHEAHRRIENTFNDPSLSLAPGLRDFIGGRKQIFAPDRNNFAPRVGVTYTFNLFGRDRGLTVLRGGYGLFYDQILGAVVSQSRNVYPTYLTVDLAGGFSNLRFVPGSSPRGDTCMLANGCPYQFINPQLATIFGTRIVQPGTLNTLNPASSFAQIAGIVNLVGGGSVPALSGFGVTLPALRLDTPMAHHYTLMLEQPLGTNMVASVAYVGTRGRHLLRFNTPNLGRNSLLVPLAFNVNGLTLSPVVFGLTLPPGAHIDPQGNVVGGRPVSTVGVVNRFETTADSQYNALQTQLRGRLHHRLLYQAAYTFSKVIDDVSDVFDLAGAAALPQNSLNLANERGPANFDVRHRFAYYFIYDAPALFARSYLARQLFGGLQIAGSGSFQTGQPFTVNSIFDVNLDGNLTDRLNTVNGIVQTGDRRQPIRLTPQAAADMNSLLAPVGQDGQVGRNTFRAGSVLDLNAALIKNIRVGEQKNLIFRLDIFNFINRANYGIPVRYLEAPSFGQATSTVTPARRVQFALKFSF